MKKIGSEIVTRIIISPKGLHDEHEVIFDNPAEGYIFDRCHQRFTTINKFYDHARYPAEYEWQDIREIIPRRKV